VLLQGFAMQPEIYLPMARLLADRAQVVIPALFEVPGTWTFEHCLASFEAMLDERGLDRVSLLGHSFGGGIELGFAARHPGRIVECVFADTLAVKAHFGLAAEALRSPWRILFMASRPAATAFFRSVATHPDELASAGLWAFRSDREPDLQRVVEANIPSHVMWASRDSILSRSDGAEFARRLGASFTVAAGKNIDHDWMFDDPELFASQLRSLGLAALSG
jgi:pimeloyl-ACP methyl ester carboxylesterase